MLLYVVNATFASSTPTGRLPSLTTSLYVSEGASGLVVTLFLLGYYAGPLMWAPMSELFGRRWMSILTFACYFALSFLCAFTPNFGGLLAGRFLTGTFVSTHRGNRPHSSWDLQSHADTPLDHSF